jgi:hypothetical protein
MQFFIFLCVSIFHISIAFAQLKQSENYPYDEVNQKFIQLNLDLYNAKYHTNIPYETAWKDLNTHANGIKSLLANSQDFSIVELKTAVEKYLQNVFGKIPYEESYNNLFDVIYQRKMQCDSGTRFLLIMHRLIASKEAFFASNPLILFTYGHVLYGYYYVDEHNNKLMNGIETTVAGIGKIEFGLMSKLHQLPKSILPIEAGFYLADAIEQDLKRKKILLRASYLRQELNHGVNVGRIRKKIAKELRYERRKQKKIKRELQRSDSVTSFAFGTSENNFVGERERSIVNEQSQQSFFKLATTNGRFQNESSGESGAVKFTMFKHLGQDEVVFEPAPNEKYQIFWDIVNKNSRLVDAHSIVSDINLEALYEDNTGFEYVPIYSKEQLKSIDSEGNNPLLYSLKYHQQFGLETILGHQLGNIRGSGKLLSTYITEQKNSLGENALMAILSSDKIYFPKILISAHFLDQYSSHTTIRQKAWNDENIFHYIAHALARTYPQDDLLYHDRIMHLVDLVLRDFPHGIQLRANQFAETPLDLAMSYLVEEDSVSQHYYLRLYIEKLLAHNFYFNLGSDAQRTELLGSVKKSMYLTSSERQLIVDKVNSRLNNTSIYYDENNSKLYPPNAFFMLQGETNPLSYLNANYMNSAFESDEFLDFFGQMKAFYLAYPGAFNELSVDGKTFVHFIIQGRLFNDAQKMEIFEWLKTLPAINWEHVNHFGSNAMFYTCQGNYIGMAEFLALKQVNFFQKNNNGQSCFSLALETGNDELFAVFKKYYFDEIVLSTEFQLDHIETLVKLSKKIPTFKFNPLLSLVTPKYIETWVQGNCQECLGIVFSQIIANDHLKTNWAQLIQYYALIYNKSDIFQVYYRYSPFLRKMAGITSINKIFLENDAHINLLIKYYPGGIDMSYLLGNEVELVAKLLDASKIELPSKRYEALRCLVEFDRLNQNQQHQLVNKIKDKWRDLTEIAISNLEFFATYGIPNQSLDVIQLMIKEGLIDINLGISADDYYYFKNYELGYNSELYGDKQAEETNSNGMVDGYSAAYDLGFRKYLFPVTYILAVDLGSEETILNFFKLMPDKINQRTTDGNFFPLNSFLAKDYEVKFSLFARSQLEKYLK